MSVATSYTTRNFSEALDLLKQGKKLSRIGWHRAGMWLELQLPDENSKMTKPYVFMTIPEHIVQDEGGAQNEPELRIPWLCSQTDLLAEDWFVFELTQGN